MAGEAANRERYIEPDIQYLFSMERMMEKTTDRIVDAIEAGEIIRIVYDGGTRPGDSRDIAPIRINGTMLHAMCIASNRFKVFTIAKIREITTPDTIKSQPTTPSSSKEIQSPQDYLSSWYYHIIQEHWETLGIQRVELIDRGPTKRLRKKLMDGGMEKKEAMRHKITRNTYMKREQYQFGDGHVFWTKNKAEAVQVLKVDSDTIEAVYISGSDNKMQSAYRLRSDELIEWLQTGNKPAPKRISRYELSSEIIKYLVKE